MLSADDMRRLGDQRRVLPTGGYMRSGSAPSVTESVVEPAGDDRLASLESLVPTAEVVTTRTPWPDDDGPLELVLLWDCAPGSSPRLLGLYLYATEAPAVIDRSALSGLKVSALYRHAPDRGAGYG
ncbi:MAG: hypothetical protein ACRDQA_01845 [Nocardioidaceae bacterium]